MNPATDSGTVVMAIICPQCGEIHFETGGATPTHCRKCETDLNQVAGILAPNSVDENAKPRPLTSKTGLGWITAGAVLIVASGLTAWWGVTKYNGVKETSAKVILKKEAKDVKPAQVREQATAVYSVGGREYYLYPGVRMLNTQFPVYYNPKDPADANETRPWMFLLVAGAAFLVGLIVLIRGLFRFMVARARESDLRKVMGLARV
jgi:hypothetical protein